MLLAANATDGVTLNIGYEFLALIPLIWFWNKAPRYQYLLLLICMFFIIICMKRGAILIGIICFIYFLYATFKQSTGRLRYTIILFSIIAVLVTSAIITNMLASNDYFAYRFEQTLEGDSSNRDELYSTYFKYFISERNFFKFIFGNGANATLKVGFNFAHNDWLELAINNGICGIMIYLWCFISLIKDFIRAKKFYRFEAKAILLLFIIIFTSSLFSMTYASIDHAITITMGYALARVYR
jgi:O-antigen ligase